MIKATLGLKGRYKMQVSKNGIITRETGWFDNLITDLGLNTVATDDFMRYCLVGSSNTAPQNSDTALGTLIAAVDNGAYSVSLDTTNRYGIYRKTFTFSNGSAAGNISEVGVGHGNTGTVLFSRALVLDAQGNPTTITVQSDEDLVVVYELWVKQPTGDFTDTVNGKNITIRAANVGSTDAANGWGGGTIRMIPHSLTYAYDGSIGAITSLPSGNSSPNNSYTTAPYVADSHERSADATFGTGAANFDIKSFSWRFGPSLWQMEMDTPITKNSLQTFKFGMGVRWARDNGPS